MQRGGHGRLHGRRAPPRHRVRTPRQHSTGAHSETGGAPPAFRWCLGAAGFQFGYAPVWGIVYALVQEKLDIEPCFGGLCLATVIHLITFPDWGGAVLSGSKARTRERSWKREFLLATAPLVFGLTPALEYGHGPKRSGSEW